MGKPINSTADEVSGSFDKRYSGYSNRNDTNRSNVSNTSNVAPGVSKQRYHRRNHARNPYSLPGIQPKLSSSSKGLTSKRPPVRWLIENTFCAKVLGPGGSRLRVMRDLCREPGILTYITEQIANVEFRVMVCVASALSAAKIAGLVVRAVNNEPEYDRSTEKSRKYDFKMLIPQHFVTNVFEPKPNEAKPGLPEIQKNSRAELIIDDSVLPDSDEVVLHIHGVADAIQAAVFDCIETLERGIPDEKQLFKYPRQPYNPAAEHNLTFATKNQESQVINPSGKSIPDRVKPKVAIMSPSEFPRLYLPQIEEIQKIPNALVIAYDTARTSKSKQLRQIVRLESIVCGSHSDFSVLLSNIARVTTCNVELDDNLNDDCFATYSDEETSERSKEMCLVLHGPPEENMLALFLIYRFVREKLTIKSEA